MTPRLARLAFFSFVLMGGGIAVNLMWLQPAPGAKPGSALLDLKPPAGAAKTQRSAAVVLPPVALPRPASGNQRLAQRLTTEGEPRPDGPAAGRQVEVRDWETRLHPVQPRTPGAGDQRRAEPGNHAVRVVAADAQKPASAGAPSQAARPVSAVPEASSDIVRAVQRELAERGYEPGPVDGVPGLVTRAAIMAFEHDNGLPLTGEPGEQLLKRILLGVSPAEVRIASTVRREHAEQVIRTVQQTLAALGHEPGRMDGTLSEETRRAIRAFEVAQGMAPTGRVSGRLVSRLARAAAAGLNLPAVAATMPVDSRSPR